jgi:hypothetical protein
MEKHGVEAAGKNVSSPWSTERKGLQGAKLLRACQKRIASILELHPAGIARTALQQQASIRSSELSVALTALEKEGRIKECVVFGADGRKLRGYQLA